MMFYVRVFTLTSPVGVTTCLKRQPSVLSQKFAYKNE
jgi:hypothetical protein